MVIFISQPGITFRTTKGKLVTPNVLLIMADDMGFTDIGRFGAEIYRAGWKKEIREPPYHEYTDKLLASVPEMDSDWLDNFLAEIASTYLEDTH